VGTPDPVEQCLGHDGRYCVRSAVTVKKSSELLANMLRYRPA